MTEYMALKKIFDFSEFQYAQPRDSNSDNQAFITICNIAGEALKERATHGNNLRTRRRKQVVD